jgi:hypothetical protein
MNQTLRPQPQLAEVLPGALTLALFLLLINDHYLETFNYVSAPTTGAGLLALLGAAFLFASWIFGTLLDTIRNGVVENIADWWCKPALNWEFFVKGDHEKVNPTGRVFLCILSSKSQLYYWRVAVIAISLFWFPTGNIGRVAFVGMIFVFIFCAIDAISLRSEIKELVGPHTSVHAGVYTRLKQSKHGVGVFAILDIPAGTNIFEGDTNEMHDIDERDLNGVPPEIRQLYYDFCVRKGDKFKGPSNFNNLTVGWYLNHSDAPNVKCDENFDFIAIREIKKDEEITADYLTYDERRPLNFTPCSGDLA